MHDDSPDNRPFSGVLKTREGGSGTRLRQGTFMVTGEREVPDPAQSTWACQVIQEPEKVGSGLTAGVETVASGCDALDCDASGCGAACDALVCGALACDALVCDVVALGTRELIT